MPEIKKQINYLTDHELQVGVLDNAGKFIMMIAQVNEYGTVIRPHKQWLTIPLNDEAVGHRAGEFKGLFKPKGKKILALPQSNGSIKPMFALVKQVVIPQRSFIRSTYDEHHGQWLELMEREIENIFWGRQTGEGLFILLGETIKKSIQTKITKMTRPRNAPLTEQLKGKNDPLVDTGKLRASVSYRIVRK